LVAQPLFLDMVVSYGLREHLDGVYSLAPHWSREVADAAVSGDKQRAAEGVQRINRLMKVLVKYEVFPTSAFLLSQLGVAGNSLPRPLAGLTGDQKEAVLKEEIVQQLLSAPRHLVV